jgi:hypothetical protein
MGLVMIALAKCGDETQVTASFVILRFVTFTFVWAGLSTEKKQKCLFSVFGARIGRIRPAE